MIDRRKFLGITVGAGATLAFAPRSLWGAPQQGEAGASTPASGPGSARADVLIRRAIPSSGEELPVVGLSFSNHPSCADPEQLQAVLRAMFDGGGRVFDALHTGAASEQFHVAAAEALGIREKLFWSVRGSPPGGPGGPPPTGPGAVKAHVEALLARLGVAKIDLAMLSAQGDPAQLAALKAEKEAGRVRYIGVQTITVNASHAQLASIMRNEPVDFVGVDYDVGNRARVEETILPLALERNIGVMAFFPFGNNGGVSCSGGHNLFGRVRDTPLPEWAADFDAATWAQFFLKYVISHPAVTVARVGTTKAHHMLDNLGGGMGRLPDEETRRRMAAFVDALPPAPPPTPPGRPAPGPTVELPAAVLDRYVGKYVAASGFTMTFRRDGSTLLAKPGPNPEGPLVAHSETRFSDPRGPNIEFQLDAAGKVTGLILEQGSQRIPLERA